MYLLHLYMFHTALHDRLVRIAISTDKAAPGDVAHVQVPKQLANSEMDSGSTKRPSSFPIGFLTFVSAATDELADHK